MPAVVESARSARSTSSPRCGVARRSTTTTSASGGVFAMRIPSSPSAAVMTSSPCCRSLSARVRRSTESSSMTRTRPLYPMTKLHASIGRSLGPLHLGQLASAAHG